MAGLTVIPTNVNIQGNLSASSFTPPAGCITDNGISAGATGNYLDNAKLEHRVALTISQTTGDSVQTTQSFYGIMAAGGVVRVYAGVDTLASGSTSQTVSIDLQRSTLAGSFATVLSTPIKLIEGDTSVARTLYSGSVTTTTGIAGDIYKLMVTIAGSTTSGFKGIYATAILYEEPQ